MKSYHIIDWHTPLAHARGAWIGSEIFLRLNSLIKSWCRCIGSGFVKQSARIWAEDTYLIEIVLFVIFCCSQWACISTWHSFVKNWGLSYMKAQIVYWLLYWIAIWCLGLNSMGLKRQDHQRVSFPIWKIARSLAFVKESVTVFCLLAF